MAVTSSGTTAESPARSIACQIDGIDTWPALVCWRRRPCGLG